MQRWRWCSRLPQKMMEEVIVTRGPQGASGTWLSKAGDAVR